MKINANRIILTSDWHFGIKSNNLEWFEIAKDYFDNFLFPWLDQNIRKGDIFYCLGDVFDNRQNLNLMIASYAIEIFEKLAKKLPVYIIVGNHDIYRKNSNEISSLDILKNIQGVTIYKEPEVHEFKNSRCLLMPWRRDQIHEKETLDAFSHIDYVFCHSEVKGLRVNPNPYVIHEGGNNIEVYNEYKGMYSGHIHYSQKKKNITFIGNIFQMSRSDRNNPKGIWTLEPDNGIEVFFENTYSPKFLKYDIESLYNKTIEELTKEFYNNFIDIKIDRNAFSKYDMSLFLNLIEGLARSIQIDIFEKDENTSALDNEEINDYDILTTSSSLSMPTLSSLFIKSSNYEDEIKQKLLKSIETLYKKVNKE